MQVLGVLETCLYAEDLVVAEEFYCQVLGMSVFSRIKGRHLFFRCGEGMFLLFNPQQSLRPDAGVPPHGAQSGGHVAFAIHRSELARWRSHLDKMGVTIEREVEWPGGGHSIYFRDPAGNSVELATRQVWGAGL
jgi:catechol 2,3-dioxygenase-like lactoylglutathione lyase family enzyme